MPVGFKFSLKTANSVEIEFGENKNISMLHLKIAQK